MIFDRQHQPGRRYVIDSLRRYAPVEIALIAQQLDMRSRSGMASSAVTSTTAFGMSSSRACSGPTLSEPPLRFRPRLS